MTVGRIAAINVSDGGVPKRPVPSAQVTTDGVDGDRQADRRHHGGPHQALCLFSLEVIEDLRADGHPIEAGSAGENLTISGLDWSQIRPGAVLRIGDELVAEVTDDTTPCSKQAGWFTDGDFTRLSHRRHPGRSRWYARVLEPGTVTTGDAVTLEHVEVRA